MSSERQKKRLAQREALKIKRRMIEKVRGSNFAFNLNLLVDGWLELESDPGTFSLLIEDFGCFGAQVDEIYDLEQKFDGPVFGFIFLFKWINNQNDRSRNQKFNSTITSNNNDNNNSNNNNNNNNNSTTTNNDTNNINNGEQSPNKLTQWSYVEDENIISKMFFAKQMISNSCATHALISILLNCDYHELNLGPVLTRLKEHTKIMDPENKGYAIGNIPELAKAHNSHASYSSLYNRNKPSSHGASGMSYVISGNQRTNLQQQKKHEAYHFVSYVPINNRLYELDGLKNYPIDHGSFDPKQDWTEKFRTVIKQRLLANKSSDDSAVSNEIRYNLMAVVPDKRVRLKTELKKLKSNLKVVQDTIQRLTKRVYSPPTVDADIPNPPYSPLSNGTLTASENGSAPNSPRQNEDDSFSDDDNKIDKFFFVKFTQRFESTLAKEENTEPAHKNCIIDTESTNLEPINLQSKDEIGPNSNKNTLDDRLETDTIPTNKDSDNNMDGDDKTNKNQNPSKNTDNNNSKTINSHNNVFKSETSNPLMEDHLKEKTTTPTCENNLATNFKSIHETKINGLTQKENKDDIKANNTTAHKNEKYNLSTKPPFDFNIIDEMQDVHFGKSTLKDLKILSNRLSSEINRIESSLKEEIDKRRKYKIDNSRRTHNYEPFIMTFLSFLAKQGNLADLIEKDLGIISEDHHQTQPLAAQNSDPTSSSSSSSISKTPKPSTSTTNNGGNNKLSTVNGSVNNRNSIAGKSSITPKPRYKYVSTGRPVGRPRKNPLTTTTPVKSTNNTK